MLGTFANIKIPMKCHRLGAFHMTFYSGDMVREMKTQTCLFTHEVIKAMMDNFYEVDGGDGICFFYPRFLQSTLGGDTKCLHSNLGGDIISQEAKGKLQ